MISYALVRLFNFLATQLETSKSNVTQPLAGTANGVESKECDRSDDGSDSLAALPTTSTIITTTWSSETEKLKFTADSELTNSPPSINVTNETGTTVSIYPTLKHTYEIEDEFGVKHSFVYDVLNKLPLIDIDKFDCQLQPRSHIPHKNSFSSMNIAEPHVEGRSATALYRITITDENGVPVVIHIQVWKILPTFRIIDAFGVSKQLDIFAHLPPLPTANVPGYIPDNYYEELKARVTNDDIINVVGADQVDTISTDVNHNEITNTETTKVNLSVTPNSDPFGYTGMEASFEGISCPIGTKSCWVDYNDETPSASTSVLDSSSDAIAAKLSQIFGDGNLWEYEEDDFLVQTPPVITIRDCNDSSPTAIAESIPRDNETASAISRKTEISPAAIKTVPIIPIIVITAASDPEADVEQLEFTQIMHMPEFFHHDAYFGDLYYPHDKSHTGYLEVPQR